MTTEAQRRVAASGRATATLFVANAVVFATIVTRYPELKEQFQLSTALFGVMVACGPVGSIVGSIAAGRVIGRRGAVRGAVTSSILLGLLLSVAGFVSTPVLFGAALFVIGVADATGDVANNAHGLEVQRRLGRSIINGLHGAWAVGAIVGGLFGFIALQLQVPIWVHLLVVGLVIVAAGFGTLRWLPLTDDHVTAPGTHAARTFHPVLIAACAVAVIGALLEDLGSTWGGVYLVQQSDAAIAYAALSFVAAMTTLTVGRFVSDRCVDRLGLVTTLRAASILAFAGVLVVAVGSSGWVIVVGFAVLGLGIAPMIPLAMQAAERAPGTSPAAGLATAATVMRLGFLASPLLVGILAEATDLRLAVTICLVAPVLSLLAAGLLRPRPEPVRRSRPTG